MTIHIFGMYFQRKGEKSTLKSLKKYGTKKINPDEIMTLDKGIVCILGLPGAGKTTLCKYFCWKTLKGDYGEDLPYPSQQVTLISIQCYKSRTERKNQKRKREEVEETRQKHKK